MTREQMIAIMSAIIFAGADDSEGPVGYGPKEAVEKAMDILKAMLEVPGATDTHV